MRSVSEIQIHSNSLKPGENNIHERRQVSFKASKAAYFESLLEGDLVRRDLENRDKIIMKVMPWFVRLADYFKHDVFSGDIANVIITALGTGIVAPIMIKYNPLSKEDQDTKTYAAWRQPISAVIAVVTQVGITKQVGNIIKKMAAKGELGNEMDTRISDKFKAKENRALKWAEKLNSIAECQEKAELLKGRGKAKIFKGIYPEETNAKTRVKDFIDNLIEVYEEKIGNNKTQVRLKRKLDKLKSLDTHEKRNNYLAKEIEKYNKIAKKYEAKAKVITSSVSKYKDLVGIGLALITLPITCDILNRVYPRFMKWAFPELSNKKENNKDVSTIPSYAKEINPKAEEIRR